MDSASLAFEPYEGPLMGLVVDENHLVFRWKRDDCKILFSVSKRGNAASAHFASDKSGLRHLRQAIDQFVLFMFCLFDWCIMVLAQVKRQSVARLIQDCGFRHVSDFNDISVYARQRWAE